MFSLLSVHDRLDERLIISNNQTSFLKRFYSIAIEEVNNLSQSLIELFIRANLLNELIGVLHEKKLLPESLEIKSKYWSFGG